MAAGQTIIAIALGAGLIASGVWFFKSDRSARGWDADQFFGDWPHLTREAQFGDARKMRAGSGTTDATDAQGTSLTHSERGSTR